MPDIPKPTKYNEPVSTITPVTGTPKNWPGSGEKVETDNSKKAK